MTDMVHIQEQSRKSYFQWHILLLLKKRRLEKTLNEAGVQGQATVVLETPQLPVFDSDELTLLVDLGLPIPDDLTGFDLPAGEAITGIRFFFRAAPAFDDDNSFVLDFVRQLVAGTYERCELIRVEYDDHPYLQQAATKFNLALANHGTAVVYNAARVWSGFHGAIVQPWLPVSARLLGVGTTADDSDWYPQPATTPPNADQSKRQRRINLGGRKRLFGGA